MSSILYYSNYCENCKTLLQVLAKSEVKKDIHFLCIDQRINKNTATYIVMSNGQEMLLPPTVTKVPALLLLNKGHQVIFGEEIYKYLSPSETVVNKQVQGVEEPSSFSLNESQFGVLSDSFSFLDQEPSDLSTKGDGGVRQMYHYSTLNETGAIETPPEDYVPDKIGNVSMDTLQEQRQQAFNS
jgi:hypothetical protein